MKKITLKEEIKRMQKLAGILSESSFEEQNIHPESGRLKSGVGLLLSVDNNVKSNLKGKELPEGQTRLPDDKFHVTLTSIRNFKPFSSDMKDLILPKTWKDGTEVIIPTIKLGEYKSVFRPEQQKETYVASVENQNDLKSFVDKLYEEYGHENPEPNRFFHITVSNNAGGDPFKSIGDVTKQDFNLSQENQIQVWFDLDGVLADMEGELQKSEELQSLKANLDDFVQEKFPEWTELSNDELKEKFKNGLEQDPENQDLKELKKVYRNYNNYVFKIAGKVGFYAGLDLMPGAIELVKRANEITGKKSNILTAPAGNENDPNNPSVIEKRAWVEENFGDLVNKVEVTIDKGRVVKSKYDILIDDRTKYVDKFESAGGSAILYKDANQAANELQDLYNELTTN